MVFLQLDLAGLQLLDGLLVELLGLPLGRVESQERRVGGFVKRDVGALGLFEQAGVPVPSDESDEVTWEEWAAAATEVAA